MGVRVVYAFIRKIGSRHVMWLALAGVVSQALAAQDPDTRRRTDLRAIHKDVELLMTLPKGSDRRWAVVRLGCAGPAAVSGVCLLLDDPRLEVRALVYRILEEIGRPAKGAVPSLQQRFASKDLWERVRAAQLALAFDPECEPAMFVLAGSVNREYRRRAAGSLWRATGPRTVHVLAELVDDRYESVRAPAIRSLSECGDRAGPVIPKLIDAMTSKGAGKLEVEDIPGAMVTGGKRLRGANRALFELGSIAVEPLLKRHAKAGPELQFRILHVLGAMGAADAQRQAIRVSLLAKDAKLRQIAFACLMNLEFEVRSDLPVLLEAGASFKTAKDRERIRRYLEAAAPQPIVVLRTAFSKVPAEQREVIVSVLSSLPTSTSRVDRFQRTELLVLAVRDKAERVRSAAVRSILGRLTTRTDAATLRTLFSALEGLVERGVGLPLPVLEKRAQAIAASGPETARAAAKSLLRAVSLRQQQGQRR